MLNTSSSLFITELKKFTIFIIHYKLDEFDIADPRSMQDACRGTARPSGAGLFIAHVTSFEGLFFLTV